FLTGLCLPGPSADGSKPEGSSSFGGPLPVAGRPLLYPFTPPKRQASRQGPQATVAYLGAPAVERARAGPHPPLGAERHPLRIRALGRAQEPRFGHPPAAPPAGTTKEEARNMN